MALGSELTVSKFVSARMVMEELSKQKAVHMHLRVREWMGEGEVRRGRRGAGWRGGRVGYAGGRVGRSAPVGCLGHAEALALLLSCECCAAPSATAGWEAPQERQQR